MKGKKGKRGKMRGMIVGDMLRGMIRGMITGNSVRGNRVNYRH